MNKNYESPPTTAVHRTIATSYHRAAVGVIVMHHM